MRPQTRLLLTQPQIIPPQRLRTDRFAASRRLALLVFDDPIDNRMHNLNAGRTILLRQRLRERPCRRARSTISGKIGIRAHCAESACEDESALFEAALRKGRMALLREEHFDYFLAERHCAADESVEAVREVLVGLLKEWLLTRMFDVIYGYSERQVSEGSMTANICECFGEFFGGCVGWETDDRIGGGGLNAFSCVGQVFRIASEEGYGEIAMRWVR